MQHRSSIPNSSLIYEILKNSCFCIRNMAKMMDSGLSFILKVHEKGDIDGDFWKPKKMKPGPWNHESMVKLRVSE